MSDSSMNYILLYLLHGLSLSSRSYPAYREAHVYSWPDTLVKQLSFQKDLTISDGNHICRNVC